MGWYLQLQHLKVINNVFNIKIKHFNHKCNLGILSSQKFLPDFMYS
jgi:hypothetical protein